MPVAVVVQAVEQAHAFGRHEALAVQEGGGRLQGGRLAPAQYLVEDEAEQAVVGPLAAFEQQDLARREEHHPAGRMALAEHPAGDDVAPGLPEDGFGRRGLAVVLHPVGAEGEGVFVVSVRIVGAEDEKLCGALPDPGGVKYGHLVAGLFVQWMIRRLEAVAKGGQELAEPLALQANAVPVPALVPELLPELEVGMGQGAQGLVRRPLAVGAVGAVGALGGGLAPAGGRRLDVVGEELGEVVVAVELVLVLDAGEGGGHGGRAAIVQPSVRPAAWLCGRSRCRSKRSSCSRRGALVPRVRQERDHWCSASRGSRRCGRFRQAAEGTPRARRNTPGVRHPPTRPRACGSDRHRRPMRPS